MTRSAATLAKYVLIEAARSGLPWLALACLIAVLALSGFLSQIAITEGAALQASVAAALLRICAVFIIATHVVTSIAREANDKGLELALSLPLSRTAWYVGKLAGFACTGVALAFLFGLPLLYWSPPAPLAGWLLGLAAELVLTAAVALFFASAMSQAVGAIAATLGFYFLARALPAIQAIAAGPLAGENSGAGAARWTMDAIAWLFPRLDALARSDWLVYGLPGAGEVASALAGVAIYLVLMVAAGLFDLSRRNL